MTRMAIASGKSMTYNEAGVDVDAGPGPDLLRLIHPLVERTHTARVIEARGPFAGMFSLDFREGLLKRNYRDPVLVACTDGVGEKLTLALAADKLDTIGIDLVAMTVNDLICCGAEPLFFLGSLAADKLSPHRCQELFKGMSQGCLRSGGLAMLGGRAAELPDVLKPNGLDLTGFTVGLVERRRIVDGSHMQVGDCAIALASDGLHSHGYELAQRVLLERGGHKLADRPAELEGATVGEELLRPTRIYAAHVLDLLGRYRVKRVVKAIAHIKGGGLAGNLPRALPPGLTVRVKRDSWSPPGVFRLIAKAGPVDADEMMQAFNMGIGLVLIVAPYFAKAIMNRLRLAGERCWMIGRVCKGEPPVTWA
jgi:phosphoribosylformylglycinamidine cyclo-ligase